MHGDIVYALGQELFYRCLIKEIIYKFDMFFFCWRKEISLSAKWDFHAELASETLK